MDASLLSAVTMTSSSCRSSAPNAEFDTGKNKSVVGIMKLMVRKRRVRITKPSIIRIYKRCLSYYDVLTSSINYCATSISN